MIGSSIVNERGTSWIIQKKKEKFLLWMWNSTVESRNKIRSFQLARYVAKKITSEVIRTSISAGNFVFRKHWVWSEKSHTRLSFILDYIAILHQWSYITVLQYLLEFSATSCLELENNNIRPFERACSMTRVSFFSYQTTRKKIQNLLVNTLVVIEFDSKILIDTTLPNHVVIFKVNMLNLKKSE